MMPINSRNVPKDLQNFLMNFLKYSKKKKIRDSIVYIRVENRFGSTRYPL